MNSPASSGLRQRANQLWRAKRALGAGGAAQERASGNRTGAQPEALSEAEAAAFARAATPECVLVRARRLEAGGHPAAGRSLRRSAWRLGRTRAEMIDLTFAAAAEDDEFRRAVEAADKARDGRDWAEAAGHYARALSMYPFHSGYRVQLAHMLKELGRFEAAEIDYREALALGAPLADVLEHLQFVCHRQHHYLAPPPFASSNSRHPLQERPTCFDIQSLAYAIWHVDGLSQAELLNFQRSCSTVAAVAAMMIADERFRRSNSAFLQMLGK
jgi:tetratricopeptide (TPR) repeat protein